MIESKYLIRLTAAASIILITACSAPQPQSADDGAVPQNPDASATTHNSAMIAGRPKASLPDGFEITMELAITPEEQMRGLMYRTSLPEDRGMLFIHQQPVFPVMWMKHTLIPLDLIFLGGDGTVVDFAENAEPCPEEPCPQYRTKAPTFAVLELVGGAISRHGIEIGSRIEFEHVPDYPMVASE
jgi:uncharacterized membrane protein (UPF0127 family)